MNIGLINLQTIDGCLEKSLKKKQKLVELILSYNSDNVDILSEEERAFPGNKNFYESGYYKTMLKRYFFAADYFCKRKKVLDTCCGLGWGTYIVSHYAKEVTAFDVDRDVIDFCKKQWPHRRLNWLVGDALNLGELANGKFDVALGMETIEHFTQENGRRYVEQTSRALKKNGIFIGTSAFPETPEEAENLCKRNPYHLHIFTHDEMSDILGEYFSEYVIINNWMFIAKK